MTTLKSKIQTSRRKARKKIKAMNRFSNLLRNKVVHHLDEDPLNNDLDNLFIMSDSFHTSLHWVLNPIRENMGPKSKSIKQRFRDVEKSLILYNFNL